MCRLVAGDHILAGDECCSDDPDDCDMSTVEGDMLKEACDEIIYTINSIKELVDEGTDEVSFTARCIDLTIEVGELVRQVVEYTEPDAGLESTD